MPRSFFFFLFLFFLFTGCINFSNEQRIKQSDEQTTTNQSILENSSLENSSLVKNSISSQKSNLQEINQSSNYSFVENQSINSSILSKCEGLDEENKTKCYINLAIDLDEPNYCFFVDYGEEFKNCLDLWCKKIKKSYIWDCEKYSDAKKRILCLENCITKER